MNINKIGKICTGNFVQHSLAFKQNYLNVLSSIQFAINNGCAIRVGKELEMTGFSMGSHFKELDTYLNMWYYLKQILEQTANSNILIELGMPLIHNLRCLNCLVYLQKGKILQIRTKSIYHKMSHFLEIKYFTKIDENEKNILELPKNLIEITQQKEVTFSQSPINLEDFLYCSLFEEEIKTDLFYNYLKQGVKFFNIVSSRIFEAGKFEKKIQFYQKLSKKNKIQFLIHGLVGSEGGKFVFEGGTFYFSNGEVFELNRRFQFEQQSHQILNFENFSNLIEQKQNIQFLEREEEIKEAAILYFWNYFFKTKSCGFIVPLSGGADSCITSLFLYLMCKKICESSQEVHQQFCQLTDFDKEQITVPENLVKKIFYTFFLPMNFSGDSQKLSKAIAQRINSNHLEFPIQTIFDTIRKQIVNFFEQELKFQSEGGDKWQDLVLQNIQARLRLLLCYAFTQTLPIKFKLKSRLLVLATGNTSEVLRGYYTKYDNSSGDFNLIGSLNKKDIWKILKFYSKKLENFEILEKVAEVPPTAQLTPLIDGKPQTDEGDMGFSYKELDFLGEHWIQDQMGPSQLEKKILEGDFKLNEEEIKTKVFNFFRYWEMNRHKSICLPPQVHLTSYNCDGFNHERPSQYLLEEKLGKKELDDFFYQLN